MSNVIRNIKDPKPDDEDGDGGRTVLRGVAEEPPDVSGETDDENSEDDGGGADNYEGPAAAEAASAAVTHVAH